MQVVLYYVDSITHATKRHRLMLWFGELNALNCGVYLDQFLVFFFSSRRRHTRSLCDWSSDVCSSDLAYALGGYSRLYLGANSPYHSELNAIHGGLGERIFFVGDRVALRLEARAYYRGPGGGMTSPHWVGHFTGTVGLSFLLGGGGETKSY